MARVIKNWSLIEECGKLVAKDDLLLCAVFINGDKIGHTPTGAITVHGQSKSYETGDGDGRDSDISGDSHQMCSFITETLPADSWSLSEVLFSIPP